MRSNTYILLPIDWTKYLHNTGRNRVLHHSRKFFRGRTIGGIPISIYRNVISISINNRHIFKLHPRDTFGHQPLNRNDLVFRRRTAVLHNRNNRSAGFFFLVIQGILTFFSQCNRNLGILHTIKQTNGRADTILQFVELVGLLIRISGQHTRIILKRIICKSILWISCLNKRRLRLVHRVLFNHNRRFAIKLIIYAVFRQFLRNLLHFFLPQSGKQFRIRPVIQDDRNRHRTTNQHHRTDNDHNLHFSA